MRAGNLQAPPPISAWITGAVSTSPLPFRTARWPCACRRSRGVTSRKMRGALGVHRQVDLGLLGLLSKPGWASVRLSPVRMTWRFTITGGRRARGALGAERHRAAGLGGAASAPFVDQRTSSVAVRPRMSPPWPCPARRAAAPPRGPALLLDHRLGHAQFVDAVVQRGDVLLDACSCTLRRASGLAGAASRGSVPWVGSTCRSGELVGDDALRAGVQRVGLVARDLDGWPSRLMPPWRTFFSRSATRMSPASVSRRLVRPPACPPAA